MTENSGNRAFSYGMPLFLIIVLISILSWITYGTIEGVLGMLSFLLLGLLCIFPWIIPFAGIPLGIVDLLGIWGFRMYDLTLVWAHLPGSWLPLLYYWLIILVSSGVNCLVMYFLISKLLAKKPDPKTNIALVNCNIIDGNRDSKIIRNGVVLIKNIVEKDETPGLIIGVGSNISIPDDYKKIDLEGQYLLPGLINAHCHMFATGAPTRLMSLNISDDFKGRVLQLLNNPILKRIGVKVMHKNIMNALNAGVTTLRSAGEFAYIDVMLKKKLEKGELLGPRILVSGQAICPTGGHGDFTGFTADSKTEMRKRVRTNARKEVDFIKIMNTGGVMDAKMIGEAGRPQMTIEEIEFACEAAHRAGLMVATHCESTQGIEEALKGGVDSVDHGAEITDDLVPLFKNNPKALRGYTVLIPTLSAGMGLATLPRSLTKITEMSKINGELIEVGMIKSLQKAYKEGIKIACGTDASVPYSTHYNVWVELKYYLHYTNMTPQEAIYFGTKSSAEAIGIGDITGSIEVGKSADLQVVPGNPLEDFDNMGNVKMVIIKGHVIKNPKVKKIKTIEKNPITELVKV